MFNTMTPGFEKPKRLAVSGIAWETSDDYFQRYFNQFGEIEHAEVVRDRQGKSKGFGFVSFVDAEAVERVLQMPHVLDNRRIEVKVDLRNINRNRIFVARIPPEVNETEFRNHFEQFGRVQDAYMPRDHTKQGYRGIGFVTFDESTTVDRVIRMQHVMGGVEVAVDRALIKGDNIGPVPTTFPTSQQVDDLSLDLWRLTLGTQNVPNSLGFQSPHSIISNDESGLISPKSNNPEQFNQLYGHRVISPTHGYPAGQPFGAHFPVHQVPQNVQNVPPEYLSALPQDAMTLQDLMGVVQQGPLSSRSDRVDNPGPANANAGPRIFVGKLSKDTTEQDVREYFSQFGYVLDVYMPKSKDNKREHRGFGFVTFETDAAIKRVVSFGIHKVKGSNIAIDVAVPRKEDMGMRSLSPTSPTGIISPQPPVDMTTSPVPFLGDGTHLQLQNIMGTSPEAVHGMMGQQQQSSFFADPSQSNGGFTPHY